MADEPVKPTEPEKDTKPTDSEPTQDSQVDKPAEQPDTAGEASEQAAGDEEAGAGKGLGDDEENDEDDVAESSIIDVVPSTETIDYFPPPPTQEYNPSKDREKVRGRIAMVLIWSLVIFIGFSLFTTWIVIPNDRSAIFLDVLQIVLGPLIGLVGAVTGFYYGEKSN